MSITPTTNATNGTTTTTSASGATAGPSVSENQFLQLMMAELKNQNPMNPSSSDPTQFVTELAQFTALEQQTNTAQSTSQTAQDQNNATAIALIGHTVTYTDGNGNSVTGTVQKVDFTGSGPTLTIGGTSGIPSSAVNEVS